MLCGKKKVGGRELRIRTPREGVALRGMGERIFGEARRNEINGSRRSKTQNTSKGGKIDVEKQDGEEERRLSSN